MLLLEETYDIIPYPKISFICSVKSFGYVSGFNRIALNTNIAHPSIIIFSQT